MNNDIFKIFNDNYNEDELKDFLIKNGKKPKVKSAIIFNYSDEEIENEKYKIKESINGN